MILLSGLNIIFSLASGPTMPLLWSMLADAADYSDWKNGRRATGLVYSASTFSQKAGFSLGGAISMAILSLFGYVAETQQTTSALLGIRLSLSVIPAIIAIVSVIALLFYTLDEETLTKIKIELAERNSD